MGLEGVELVIAMEEAFDITISDQEAENISTPEEAIALITNKVQICNDDSCLNQLAFHCIRKVLVDEYGVNRRNINTESNLSKLVIMDKHSELWNRLKKATNIQKWPDLSRPLWVVYAAWVFFGISSLYAGSEMGYVLGCLVGLVIFTLLMLRKP